MEFRCELCLVCSEEFCALKGIFFLGFLFCFFVIQKQIVFVFRSHSINTAYRYTYIYKMRSDLYIVIII